MVSMSTIKRRGKGRKEVSENRQWGSKEGGGKWEEGSQEKGGGREAKIYEAFGSSKHGRRKRGREGGREGGT